jgi:ABC-2 type transport system permease protein
VGSLRDTLVVFRRYFRRAITSPLLVSVSLVQPILYLLLFAPLLTSVPGLSHFASGSAYQWFVPGLMIQIAIFSISSGGWSLISELRSGVLERMWVTPVSRLGLLLGRVLRDIATLVAQAVIIVAVAIPFGLAPRLPALLLAFLLVALLGLLMATVSYMGALKIRNEDAFGSVVFGATLPLMLLSGMLLPMSLAPRWLQGLADVNPLLYAVNAERALFAGNVASASVITGFAVIGGLAVLAVGLASREFRQATV